MNPYANIEQAIATLGLPMPLVDQAFSLASALDKAELGQYHEMSATRAIRGEIPGRFGEMCAQAFGITISEGYDPIWETPRPAHVGESGHLVRLLILAAASKRQTVVRRRRDGALPDVTLYHDPSPPYLRTLVDATGLSQNEVARKLGISERSLCDYLNETDHSNPAPYPVQVALEELVRSR